MHSTLEFARSAVDKATESIPAKKLTLGVPFYGRHKTSGTAKTYKEIVENSPGGKIEFTENEVDDVFFNGPEMIKSKTDFAMDMKIGGVMIWELGQDFSPSHELSLLSHVHCVVSSRRNDESKRRE